jgi:translation initiation factor 1 (eIF-1/SUI1)
MITDFKPRIKNIKFLQNFEDSEEEKENVILKKDEKIEVEQLFKPNQTIKPVFEKYDKNFDNSSYYPLKHCTDVLCEYLKANNLFLKGGMVKIDENLTKLLFKYEKEFIDSCKMDDILIKWKKNLNEKSFITKTGPNNEQTILTNNQLKVKIYARKIGNKKVTIIDGLQNFANVKEVIKIFAKHFACAVTLKEFQNCKEAVFVQGYWITEIIDLLQNEIKLNKQFIEVEDKLKLKKK